MISRQLILIIHLKIGLVLGNYASLSVQFLSLDFSTKIKPLADDLQTVGMTDLLEVL
jgi:hypothetical protein